MSPLHRQIRSYGPYRINLGPSRLFLDDIQDIISAIESFAINKRKQETSDSEVTTKAEPSVLIVAGNATADSVDDLREATREELNHLSLALDSPEFRVDLWHIDADITTVRDDPDARALADDITAFIKRKRSHRPISWLQSALATYILIFAGGNLAGTIYSIIHHLPFIPPLLYSIMWIASGMFFILRDTGKRGAIRVIAMKRNESRRLSSRARRDIVIAVIASAIGALVIAISGLWAGVFAK